MTDLSTETPTIFLGSVYLSSRPGTPVGRFEFIVDADDGTLVEIGTPVAADTSEGVVVGTVVDMRTVGRGLDPMQEASSFSWSADRVGHLPEAMVAEVQVFHSNLLRPVIAGRVRAASPDEMLEATGYHNMTWPIPAGVVELLGRDGASKEKTKICFDGVFLLGPEAQGIVTSGRSGIASKSSFSTVLVKSAITHGNDRDHRVGAIMFNIKGEDLIYLDKPPAAGMELTDDDLAMYEIMGIDPTPFDDVAVYGVGTLDGHTSRSPREDATTLRWDLPMAWKYLRFFFPDMYQDEKFSSFIYAFQDVVMNDTNQSVRVDTFDKLATWFDNEIDAADDAKNDYCFGGRVHVATMRRLKRQILGLRSRGEGIFCGGKAAAGGDIPVSNWHHGQVVVADLAGMSNEVKGFVIARTIDRVMRAAENGELGVDHMIICFDEANEYAPATGGEMGVVRKAVQKVATQGRYAGVSLFAMAQQASKIDELLRDNCASRAVGNSPESELTSGVYGKMPNGLIERLATLGKGQMALWHTAYRQAIVVRFPRPAWQMGKSKTSAGQRQTMGSVLRDHLSDKAMSRLTEGLTPEDVETIAAGAGSLEATVSALTAARTIDMSKSAVHAPRTFDRDDPFNID